MAIDWRMGIMPDVGGDIMKAFEAGQQKRKQEVAQNALAAYATNPNEQSLNALAPHNPGFVIEQRQAMQKQEQAAQAEQRKAMLEGAKVIGEAALYADTPEKWDQAVDYLAQFYPEIAKQKGKFSPELRNAAIASAGEMKTKIEQDSGFTLTPGAKRFGPDGRLIAEAPLAPRPVTLNPEQTLVGYDPNASTGDPASIWKNMLRTESGGQHFRKDGSVITSPAGAIGIAQVMPGTAPEAARLAGMTFDEQRYRNDPAYNEALGKAYFQKQLETFGDPAKAVAAYNAGPGNVQKAVAKGGENWQQYLPAETKGYLQSVLGNGATVLARGAPKAEKPKEAPAGYRWTNGGDLQPIPGGPADKSPKTDPGYSQSAIDAFNRAIDSGGRLLKHPGFSTAVGAKGLTGGLLGGWVVPGTDAADFKAELDAMKAQVFLPMVQSMKGMGALSNAEGEKLTAAIGALDPKMSEGGFTASLNRIITDLKNYRDRGAKPAAPAKQAAQPQAGGWGKAKVVQ